MENPLESVIRQVWSGIAAEDETGRAESFAGEDGSFPHAGRLASALAAILDVTLEAEDVVQHPGPEKLARHIDERRGTPAAGLRRAPADESASHPASFSQRGIWFIDQYSAKRSAYNAPFILTVNAPVDTALLDESLRTVVQQHEVLRTTFGSEDGEVVQYISPEPRRDFSVVELTVGHTLDQVVDEVVDTEFDLAGGPLVRVVCAVEPGGMVHVVCNVHHIVFDAASAGVFLTQWFTRYEALKTGDPVDSDAGQPQYRDFAHWQRENLGEDRLADLVSYWEAKLAGPVPLLDLPLDRSRPAEQAHDGDIVRFAFPGELAAGLRSLAAAEGVTLFMLLLSAYAAFLHKHTRQEDILIGSPASQRDSLETRGMIGYFVNMIVFRHALHPGLPMRELYRQVSEEVADSLGHKDAPFEKVIERVNPPRSASHSPLFQTMFVMPDSDWDTFERLGLDIDLDLYVSRSAKYDLSLIVEQDGETLNGVFEYSTALFDRDTVEAFGARFTQLLRTLVDEPDTTIGALWLLTETEQRETLGWCAPGAGHDTDRPVAELFEEQAARTPDALAVEHEDEALTYGELNARANQLARALRAKGVTTGQRVGIHLRRSSGMITALLGILKSGAAYVPVDPAYPPDRVAYMLADSGVSLIVSEAALADRLPGSLELFDPVAEAGPLSSFDTGDLGRVKDGGDEIYVIYTSGSTGQPKGVVLTEATITNLVEYQRGTSPTGATGRTLQYMTLSFDVSVMEILGTLCAGGTLVMIDEELQKDLHLLSELVNRRGITRMYLPYIAVQQIAALAVAAGTTFPSLEEVASVGEQLVVTPQIREFFAHHTDARFLNMYGPSESHLASAHELTGDPACWPEAPPIGGPIGGITMLALDDDRNLVPPGVPGELYLGGGHLSPGYHGLAEQTRRRFVSDPFTAGGTLYRTGDLVRVTREREFEYLGRTDAQLKIRGYRIEPAEVEAALNDLPQVAASAVAPVTFGPGDRRLVGFLVTAEEPDPVAVRGALARLLPDYLIPSHLVRLDRIPTAPSGKIDRKALPGLFEPTGPAEVRHATSATERAIAAQWADLIKGGEIGVEEDFFAAGGHSILATELMYRLRTEFDVEVPLRTLFENPTIAGMAARIDALKTGGPATGAGLDLRADVKLPDRVRVAPDAPVTPEAEATDVLLTGATGFLGIYLLRDLMAEPDLRVHCLIRAADTEAAWRKLRAVAGRYQLEECLDSTRIVPVPGDLAEDRFGLGDQAYLELANRVDAVYHAAAHINFVAPYASVKAANVDGFARVVEFSAQDRVKPVHYTSTVAVFSPSEHQGEITEDDVPQDDQNLTIGYTQSKWVAEQLVLLARERGVPVTVYRIGRIAGDSETGACQPEDFLWRQIKSFIQLGSAPPVGDTKTDLLPVDFVSRAVVRLSRGQTGSDRTWHLFNPRPVSFDVVHSAIRDSGFPLAELPAGQWFAALEKAAAEGDNALAAAVPLFQEGALDVGSNTYGNRLTMAELDRLGLSCPAITPAVFANMIGYFRRTGELAR